MRWRLLKLPIYPIGCKMPDDILLSQFTPTSKLVVKATEITQPKFPVFDAHNHLSTFGGHWDERPVSELLDALDAAGVTHYVDLDGGWGEDTLQRHLDNIKSAAHERYYMFSG